MIAYELSCRYSDTLYYRSGENTVEEFDGIITLCWKYSVVQAFSWNNEVDEKIQLRREIRNFVDTLLER